MLKDWKAK